MQHNGKSPINAGLPPIETLYGIVTTGEVWKFLRLRGTEATIDTDDYFLNKPEKIVGIILSMLR